ncbi:hypothetical protein MVEN_01022000 [Mycena venus]|uniref:Uncharacterized protein n=1 Tax=Mycena venus TaxID=2733690 RepID=A0A8H7D2Z9_9AGAR|nr:hypothetical protein MVEN_01022000 [Mycena venus]
MEAIDALYGVAKLLDGAQAIVSLTKLDYFLTLLESPNPKIREVMCGLVARLASHGRWTGELAERLAFYASTALAPSKLEPCMRLVMSLLHDRDYPQAISGLARVACWLPYAQIIVDAKATDYIPDLLESLNQDVRKWTCELVAELAKHGSTAPAIFKLQPYVQLVSLLCDGHSDVVASAMRALAEIARWMNGAQAIVDAKATDHILDLLKSQSPDVRRQTCELVAELARHVSTVPAIFKLQPYVQLVSLLRGVHSDVVGSAMRAFAKIARHMNGAQAVVDAKATDYILDLLKSQSPDVRRQTCELVAELARHVSTAPAIFKLQPYVQLAYLLRYDYFDVVGSAMRAFAKIARQMDGDGAQAIVDTRTTDYILDLLESQSPDVRRRACELVTELARHGSTAPAIFKLQPYVQLVSLLFDDHSDVVASAMRAFAKIARWMDGAQSIVDAKVTDHILDVLESQSPDVRRRTCELVGWLAFHKLTASAILKLKPYSQLVYLLRDPDADIRDNTIFALNAISRCPDGVAVLAHTDGVLQRLEELNDDRSLDLKSQVQTRNILHNIAQYRAGNTA